MNRRRWYYAHLRWAVMVDGKEGLRQWEEAVHIFLSEDRDTAFHRALEIGLLAKSKERTEHSRAVCTASTARDRDAARRPRSKP